MTWSNLELRLAFRVNMHPTTLRDRALQFIAVPFWLLAWAARAFFIGTVWLALFVQGEAPHRTFTTRPPGHDRKG